ncbi:Peptidase S1, PA clan [Phytophthora cactorum]|nr:Peptidase S1, PA clan [Phytophthora cactorum]
MPLAAADGSDIKYGETAKDRRHIELQRADVQLMSNEECSKVTSVDDTRMCSRPIGNQQSCTGDYGGPLIVERPELGDDCMKPGYPSYYSRIPVGRDWIESTIGDQCFH